VDGENFRRSIGDLYPNFRKEDYLPKRANWEGFFDWLVEEKLVEENKYVIDSPKRLRAYWYVIENVDYQPYKIPSPETAPKKFEEMRSRILKSIKNPKNRTKLNAMSSSKLIDVLNNQKRKFSDRFAGWQVVHYGIARDNRAVEFRRAGAIQYFSFEGRLGSEKAVDVKLATDMLLLKDNYEVAMIVSGDQDFVPAVRAVKDFGKIVLNVAFRTDQGDLLPGGARRLNEHTDFSIEVEHKIFQKYLFPRS